MTWEINGTAIALGALAISVLAHARASIWWAATITTNLENITNEIKRFRQEVEKESVETQSQLKAAWKRIDENRERVVKVEERIPPKGGQGWNP